jgi:hypothetical protein
MRGHFRHLHFKNFPMTPRTLKYEEIWPLQSSSEFSEVSEDSNFPLLGVWDSPSHLAQSGVATHPIPPSSIPVQMDQVVDLDSPATWARVIAERVALFRRVMPMAMENLSIVQHRNTLWYAHTRGGSYKPKVTITNLRWNNLMLVTLCISNSNLMIL